MQGSARWVGALGLLVFGVLGVGGCSGGHLIVPGDGGTADRPVGGGDGAADAAASLAISPQDAVITVVPGQPMPTVQYAALRDGQQVTAAWSVDRGELGAITGSGLFTASGTQGGKALISADFQGTRATTTLTITIQRTDIGDPAYPAPTPGAGGYGGVGGDGPGSPATTDQQNTLNGTPTADATVKLLYPYDQTVWPRAILAPLLQWAPGSHSFDAAYLHIKEDNFEYKGYFAKPNAAKPFINLPIPQAAWTELTYSNAGEPVTVTLVLAEGNTAYGPYTLTWKVAHATLKGTVYYNSYGTELVKNGGFGTYPNGTGPAIGGATLAIKPGATDPVLVAGTNSSDSSGCRVCHAVTANGSRLITQHGPNYYQSSLYDLLNGNSEATLPCTNVAYPALYPDGSLLFSGSGGMRWGDSSSRLYALPGCSLVTGVTGLPAGLQVTLPTFSPDGKHLAFNFWAGATGADQKSLGTMDFDAATSTFSNLRVLHTPTGGPVTWSSFVPTNDAVIFEVETASTSEYGFTRNGIRGELWWVDLATKTATRLDQLNGKGYVPTAGNNHGDDTTVNYEPTVSPIASGGYAWVVFTSRRLYGNVATLDPWTSDPRNYDMTAGPTCKKLWVAAIDLNAAPGTDPSHPAFYVPAQEILAGNSRGFWSLDACHQDGVDCQSGDECCGGYCEPTDGGYQCTSTPPTCAQEYERCDTDTDCCGYGQGISCINGYCTSTIG